MQITSTIKISLALLLAAKAWSQTQPITAVPPLYVTPQANGAAQISLNLSEADQATNTLYVNGNPPIGNAVVNSLSAPTIAPTLASGGAGALTGVYNYGVACALSNATFRTESGPVASITLSANQVSLTNIPLCATPAGSQKIIYRTVSGGPALQKKFLVLIPNSQTTYTDNAVDGTLGPAEQIYNNTAGLQCAGSSCTVGTLAGALTILAGGTNPINFNINNTSAGAISSGRVFQWGSSSQFQVGTTGVITQSLGVKNICTHGTNGTCGVTTVASGIATISYTTALSMAAAGGAGDTIKYVWQTCASCGYLALGTVTSGTGFVINSYSAPGVVNATDSTSLVSWWIEHIN